MRIEHFKYCFNKLNGFYLTKEWILFRKPIELWNQNTGDSIVFDSFDDLFNYSVDGKTVKEIIESTDVLYLPPLEGGRGASGTSTFKFNHAGGDKGKDKSTSLFPAYANVRIKSKTLEGAMDEFQKRFKDADHEWAYEVDEQGYVHQYIEGARTSVMIASTGKNTMILHNHPSGGAFSDSDLISTSMDRNSKGIVASGKKYDYVFTKGTHFKANEFIKAVKNAQMTGKDYDSAVDNWLTKNQKKFGYKYYRKKN